ncbi:MAG: class I tRNA ligase family protein, partial [Candidatus Pacebacteria bacterium]|nr:class I tRNA ligase family protein [Candidatus Paceibacterota bacterium]
MQKYDHKAVEQKWRDAWDNANVYRTTEDSDKEKFYILDMFPYPSGEGLHVGHPKGFIATDIISRYKKMKGFNVLHPMGWDAFGLPAEQHALKNKEHPKINTDKNIARYKEQLENISLNYDWSREISTTDPDFYKWTQWTFIQMFKKGLVFESNEPINWCPSCKTGLANEDLEDGKCERCDTEIEKKPIRQWVIKITDYADRLLADIDKLDWQESIKESQRNWIGKSEGAEIDFVVKDSDEKIKVFTTRPDTLFGATYMVLAPEHPLVTNLVVEPPSLENKDEVEKYVETASKKSHIERGDMTKEKTGVELKGVKAINPANNEELPIYIADYVMADYGTGAIMAVPAFDERDKDFAKAFDLPIVDRPLVNKEEIV